jgi:hypothetical protein
MRALSVRAPWWWLILHGGKDIENRDWYTSFRGRVFVHASKWYVHREVVDDFWYAQRIVPEVEAKWLAAGHPYEYLKAFGGAIVGSVEIVDCVQGSDSPWFAGKYGFVLRDPVAYKVTSSFKGSLGLFETGLTEEYLAEAAAL